MLACHHGTVLLVTRDVARLEQVDLVWHLEGGQLREVSTTEKWLGRDHLAAYRVGLTPYRAPTEAHHALS